MSGNFKGLMYTAGVVFILIIVAKLFIRMLPWLILAGGGVYLYTKVKGKLKENKSKNITNNSNMNTYSDAQGYDSGDIIDVDFEEVDNK